MRSERRVLQPGRETLLILRKLDERRRSTQTWRFTEDGRLCCGATTLCVQAKDGIFGLRDGEWIYIVLSDWQVQRTLGAQEGVWQQTTTRVEASRSDCRVHPLKPCTVEKYITELIFFSVEVVTPFFSLCCGCCALLSIFHLRISNRRLYEMEQTSSCIVLCLVKMWLLSCPVVCFLVATKNKQEQLLVCVVRTSGFIMIMNFYCL